MTDLIRGHAPEVWERLLVRLGDGESLRAITRDKDMPSQPSVYERIDTEPAFAEQYRRARARQADSIAEKALDEAEQADDPAKGRLAFDARRWFAGKVAPKKWGERQAIDVTTHTDPDSMTDEQLAAIAAGRRAGSAAPPDGSP